MKLNSSPQVPGFYWGTLEAQALSTVWEGVFNRKAHQWNDGEKVTRLTLDFGWIFPDLEEEDYQFVAIPKPLQELLIKLHHIFSPHFSEPMELHEFDNIICTVYDKGCYIDPHVDRDDRIDLNESTRRWAFREPVMGIVLKSDAKGGLYFIHTDRPNEVLLTLDEKPGSVFLMQDGARHHPFLHGVNTVQNERISITFRGMRRLSTEKKAVI